MVQLKHSEKRVFEDALDMGSGYVLNFSDRTFAEFFDDQGITIYQERYAFNCPDPLPVTLVGQLAVDKNYQGRRHAVSLLVLALKTALRAADMVGSVGVITHPLDDTVRSFYAKWGFADLPFDPRRAMMVRMVDLQRSLVGETSK
jgi:GNAT superfamily N-acetyltransferase